MTREQALRAIDAGAALADELAGRGERDRLGEMGIGTAPRPRSRGAARRRRRRRLRAAPAWTPQACTARWRSSSARAANPSPGDAVDGGRARRLRDRVPRGSRLGAAANSIAVVLDGFIVCAAALVAARLAPTAAEYMIAAHVSTEPGHALGLRALGLSPLLDLEPRGDPAERLALAPRGALDPRRDGDVRGRWSDRCGR